MNQDKFAQGIQAFTTLKEYDARVRLSQRRIKNLNERLEANPLDGAAAQELELAKAAHKFVLASRAAFKAQGSKTVSPELAQGVDPGMSEPGLVVYRDEVGQLRAKPRLPTAAEVQPLLPRDRSREHTPRARVVRERVNAGPGAREPKYAVDDSRNLGLGYRVLQRAAEQKRRVMSLAIVPKFPSERGFMLRACKGGRGIMVNGQPWG